MLNCIANPLTVSIHWVWVRCAALPAWSSDEWLLLSLGHRTIQSIPGYSLNNCQHFHWKEKRRIFREIGKLLWPKNIVLLLKFIYSEKATKFYKISTLLLSYVVPNKSKVEILQNFVAFSEYMNFIIVVKFNILVRFSGELRIPKSPFEINWPLGPLVGYLLKDWFHLNQYWDAFLMIVPVTGIRYIYV